MNSWENESKNYWESYCNIKEYGTPLHERKKVKGSTFEEMENWIKSVNYVIPQEVEENVISYLCDLINSDTKLFPKAKLGKNGTKAFNIIVNLCKKNPSFSKKIEKAIPSAGKLMGKMNLSYKESYELVRCIYDGNRLQESSYEKLVESVHRYDYTIFTEEEDRKAVDSILDMGAKAERERNEILDDHTKVSDENERLSAENKKMSSDIAQLKADLQDKDDKYHNAESTRMSLTYELRDKEAELENSKREYEQTLSKLKTASEEEKAALLASKEKVERDIKEKSSEIESLKSQLQSKDSTIDELKAKVSQLEAEKSSLRDQYKDIKIQITNNMSSDNSDDGKIELLKKELEEIKAKFNTVKSEEAKVEGEIKSISQGEEPSIESESSTEVDTTIPMNYVPLKKKSRMKKFLILGGVMLSAMIAVSTLNPALVTATAAKLPATLGAAINKGVSFLGGVGNKVRTLFTNGMNKVKGLFGKGASAAASSVPTEINKGVTNTVTNGNLVATTTKGVTSPYLLSQTNPELYSQYQNKIQDLTNQYISKGFSSITAQQRAKLDANTWLSQVTSN